MPFFHTRTSRERPVPVTHLPVALDDGTPAEPWRVPAEAVYYNMLPVPGKSEGPPSEQGGCAVGERLYDEVGLPALIVGFAVFIVCVWTAIAHPELPPLVLFWLSLAPMHLAAVGTVLLLVAHLRSPGERLPALDLQRLDVRPAALIVSAAKTLLFLYPAAIAVKAATALLMSAAGRVPKGSPLVSLLFEERSLPFWWSTAFAVIVLAPIAEEVLFRLVLFEVVRRREPRLAAVVASLAFAIAHQVPEEFPALFLLGMTLQRARDEHRSLWSPIAIHVGFNAMSLALLVLLRCLGWHKLG